MKNDLDSKDIHILRLLQNNARLSNKEIASEVGIAQSSTHDRIKKLTSKGYFQGFFAKINEKKLGLNTEVMMAVKLNNQHRSVIENFTKEVSRLPGVVQFFHMAGTKDFLLQIAVANSDDLRTFILDKMSTLDYVQSTQTEMILHSEVSNNILS